MLQVLQTPKSRWNAEALRSCIFIHNCLSEFETCHRPHLYPQACLMTMDHLRSLPASGALGVPTPPLGVASNSAAFQKASLSRDTLWVRGLSLEGKGVLPIRSIVDPPPVEASQLPLSRVLCICGQRGTTCS